MYQYEEFWNTYTGLNFSLPLFLAYMRWFDVNIIVVFEDVVRDMNIPVKVTCFFRNDFTSLYMTFPSGETEWLKYVKYLINRYVVLLTMVGELKMWNKIKKEYLMLNILVWTLSPIWSSDIITVFPFPILAFATDGKQLPDESVKNHYSLWLLWQNYV